MRLINRLDARVMVVTMLLANVTLADVNAGREIVNNGGASGAMACVSCHGPEGAGNAQAGFPRLAGLDAEYMLRQLDAYRSGTRESPIMAPVAAQLTAAEAADASAYYASQTAPVKPVSNKDEALLDEGERLALRGEWDKNVPACVSCHGPGGRGIDEHFPALAGQHASYITAQIQAWRNGKRSNDPLDLMKSVAERLTEREIEAVAAHFAQKSPTAE